MKINENQCALAGSMRNTITNDIGNNNAKRNCSLPCKEQIYKQVTIVSSATCLPAAVALCLALVL